MRTFLLPVAASLTLVGVPVGQDTVRDLDAVMERLFDPGDVDLTHAGSLGGKFGGRPSGRERLAARGGQATASAIHDGLGWLVRHQARDGRWSAAGFMALDVDGETSDGEGGRDRDVLATGLALLAFLADGQNTQCGEHADAVRRGLAWLCAVQDARTGACAGSEDRPLVLDHAVATLALVEAGGFAPYPALSESARLAVVHLDRLRTPDGGWRDVLADGRVAIGVPTTWAVLARTIAEELDLAGPSGRRVRDEWIADVRGAGPEVEGEVAPGDAEAGPLLALFANRVPVFGVLVGGPRPSGEDGPGLMVQCVDVTGTFQHGGRLWKLAERDAVAPLVNAQRAEGRFAGSWDPRGPWTEGTGGRVVATALAVLTLESYYRYTRLVR